MTAAGKSLWISDATRGVAASGRSDGPSRHEPPSISVYDPRRAAERRRAAARRSRCVLAVGRPARRGDALRHDRHASPALIDGVDGVDAIAVGAGATWVSDDRTTTSSAKIVDGAVGRPIPTGDGPGAIAVGDGAVWVAERFDGKVARIDPSTDRVITEISPSARRRAR